MKVKKLLMYLKKVLNTFLQNQKDSVPMPLS